MVVRLKTATGEIKEYQTVYGEGGGNSDRFDKWVTNCGLVWENKPKQQEECDHLDCAIYIAEHSTTIGLVSFLALIAFFPILFAPIIISNEIGGIEKSLVCLTILFLVFVLIFGGLRSWKESNELTEYRDKGTINGIGAYQIFKDLRTRI